MERNDVSGAPTSAIKNTFCHWHSCLVFSCIQTALNIVFALFYAKEMRVTEQNGSSLASAFHFEEMFCQ
jgi:hypothetical protein